jgi:CRISPR-associated protein Cas2
MPLCVIVTRDVEARYRGFLGSAMLELAPGVYAHPRMNRGVRERIWTVLRDWYGTLGRGSVVMAWAETKASGSLGLLTLGTAAKTIVDHEGILLARRAIAMQKENSQDDRCLKS